MAAQQGSPYSVGIWVLALLTCGIAIAGVAALWSGLQCRLGGNHSWMLPFVVLDAALLLRLSQFPAGPWRVIGITLVTAITTVLTAALSFSMAALVAASWVDGCGLCGAGRDCAGLGGTQNGVQALSDINPRDHRGHTPHPLRF